MTSQGDERSRLVEADRIEDWADTLLRQPPRRSSRGRALWLVLLIAVWAALAAVDVVILGAGHGSTPAAASKATARPAATASATSPSAPKTSSPPLSPGPRTLGAELLAPVGATAYGPSGLGSGDNASRASLAIDASTTTAWQTDWYRSAAFGNLQAGTGLFIDMGRKVTVTTVRLILGSAPGADLQVLTGNEPERSHLRVEASADDAGRIVTLRMARPEPARYLLIWFTLLPPDSTGTFQVSVYHVRLEGTP
jgi:putative peptidoglycan lipid II flippase